MRQVLIFAGEVRMLRYLRPGVAAFFSIPALKSCGKKQASDFWVMVD
jgi:hypothetical protein